MSYIHINIVYNVYFLSNSKSKSLLKFSPMAHDHLALCPSS